MIEAFMTEMPFTAPRPIFVGGDATEEDGFKAVSRFAGHAVRVGTGDACGRNQTDRHRRREDA